MELEMLKKLMYKIEVKVFSGDGIKHTVDKRATQDGRKI